MAFDRPVYGRLAELPSWPVTLLFAGFFGWWLVGLSAFAVAVCALPMAVFLAVRGSVRIPRQMIIWFVFLVWAFAAVIQIDGVGRLVGFAMRVMTYVGATVVGIYVYNCSERSLSATRMAKIFLIFLAFIALGGWLGILLPHVRLTTPMQLLLPSGIADNSYVQDLVSPTFAEVQQPWGAPRAFLRPNAPFAYTNGWGCNVALLVPIAVAMIMYTPSGRTRKAQIGVLLALVIPAAYTLNRGMFLGLAIGGTYLAVRMALRHRPGALLAVVVLLVGGSAGVLFSPVAQALQERTTYSSTNVGRMEIYRQAWEGALASPWLGYGAPRPSETLTISIGTQGQLWNIMYSYGFVALACFMGYFAAVAWGSRRAPNAAIGYHVALVVGVVSMMYYGFDGPQLATLMVAAAITLRMRRLQTETERIARAAALDDSRGRSGPVTARRPSATAGAADAWRSDPRALR